MYVCTVYTGFVQRIQGHPGGPFVEAVPGVANALVAAPSLIHMISGTASLIVDDLRPVLGPPRTTIAHNLGEGVSNYIDCVGEKPTQVKVGVPNEERDGFVYSTWAEFASKFELGK
jgi:hypothetical protein